MRVGVAFDFDGVLFETYRPVAELLSSIEASAGIPRGSLLAVEDVAEVLGVWDRRRLYEALGVGAWLHEHLWLSRVSGGSGSLATPMRLRGMGFRVYLVCGADATRWEKLRRVELFGARLIFDDILVYEPGGLRDALESLVEREALDRLVYLDDKPGNTCAAASVDRVVPVLVAYKPPYPMRLAWRGPHCARLVTPPGELEEAVLHALEEERRRQTRLHHRPFEPHPRRTCIAPQELQG